MGLTLEQLQQMGAKPVDAPAPSGGYTLEQLQQMGAKPAAEGPSSLEAIARGGAQGISANWADELTAKVDALKGGDEAVALKKTRELYKKAKEAHPYLYGGAEMVGSAIPNIGLGMLTGGASVPAQVAMQGALGAAQGGGGSIGMEEGDKASPESLNSAKWGAGVGGVLGGLGGYLGGTAKTSAEKLAEKATGATGKEAEKFAEGAGRELLDRNIVNFGSSPENIAANSKSLLGKTGKAIEGSLTPLDKAGVRVSNSTLVDGLESEKANLSELESGVASKIQKIIDNLKGLPEGRKLLDIERLGRKAQSKVNYQQKIDKPNTTQAYDIVARIYKGAVEDAATAANPEVAANFIADKKLYGLVKPIFSASSRQASKLAQSQPTSLLNLAAGGTGAVTGAATGHDMESRLKGALLGGAAGLGLKGIAPRLPSAGAVFLDNLGRPISLGGTGALIDLGNKIPRR